MSAAPLPNRTIRDALRVPDFRKLWAGQAISLTGDGLAQLASMIVVNQLTGSTAALAGMTIALALPQLIFGLFAGVIVDRFDRRRIMILSDILRGLLVLGLVLVRRPDQVWIFYVLGFAQASVSTFFEPARGALIPQILPREDLLAANALTQTTRVVTLLIGESLAGLLVGLAGRSWPAFTLDALSFFISAVFIASIAARPPVSTRQSPAGAAGSFEMMREGLAFLFSQRLLVGLVILLAVTMLGVGALNVLFVPYLTRQIHVPTTWMGAVGTAQVAGMVISSGLVGFLARRLSPERMAVVGALGTGVTFGLLGLSGEVISFLVIMFGVGLAMAPFQAAVSTIIQQTVPDEKRGRAGAAISTVMTLASVISMGFAGVLGALADLRVVFFLSGGLTVLAGLLGAVLMRPQPAPAKSARLTEPNPPSQ